MWLLLSAAAFCGGAVNSIAGGGTLLTFPTLLTVLSPVAANATSTFALLPGSLAAGLGYRRELAQTRAHLARLWPPSLVGGIVGSLLLTHLPERVFAGLIPWLLLGASTLLLLQRPIARWLGAHPHRKPSTSTLMAIVCFQFFVGVYGGYFGAGIGILMLSSLAFVGIESIHEMNSIKSILAATMNGVTVVILWAAGAIVWKYAIVMAIASTIGGYVGAHFGRKMRPELVRATVVTIGMIIAAYSWFRSHG